MKNQDFLNPTDNTEYIAQLAQFNTLQQMQQLAYYSNATFATSLVGKTVTMASINKDGIMEKVTDVVTAVKMNGTDFEIVVGGKSFSTKNLMEVVYGKSSNTEEESE
jgi:flagellar basal-body rod modification protein FlgD